MEDNFDKKTQKGNDFDSETDNAVTIRFRDSMEQVRVPISELESWIDERIQF